MSIKYFNPYKEEKYGKLRGDKANVYFGVNFSEALVHKIDNAYIIAGFIDKFTNVVRHYKPDEKITPGNCTLTIYGQEYEIGKKENGQWVSEKITPSLFEVALYKTIAADEDEWMPFTSSVMVDFTHVPDGMCQGKTDVELAELVSSNVKLTQCDPSGALPEYKPPVPYGGGKSKGGWRSVSPDDKMKFVIKQLQADIKDPEAKKGDCLGDLLDQLIIENTTTPHFLEIYTELVTACVR